MGLGIAISVNGKVDTDLSAAVSVVVEQRAGAPARYRIRYDLSLSSGDFPLLTQASLAPGSELAIIAPLDGKNHYLVKGPVTGARIHFEQSVGVSYIDVEGGDRCVKMGRENKSAVYNDATDSDAVNTVLAHFYTELTPDVSSTSAMHSETKHALVQRHSDLDFIHWLARRNGFLFWITCDEKGNETAHFKAPPVQDPPVTDIIVNLPGNTIESLDLTYEVERPSSVTGKQLDLTDKSAIDGSVGKSTLTLLGKQGLSDIASDTRSVHLSPPVDDAGDLTSRGQGALTEAGWFIHATCRTSVHLQKAIFAPHTVVNVRGLGARFSGKFFVWSVRHSIDAAGHFMDVELARNAWGN
jgi:phage protein D